MAGAGAGTAPGHGSATQPSLRGRAGLGDVVGRHGHQVDPLGRPPATPPLGHPHGVDAEQALDPGQRPGRPVAGLDGVDRPGAAGAEGELAAAGRHDLVGCQPQPGQPGGRTVGPGVQPPVELPAHPVGDGQRR